MFNYVNVQKVCIVLDMAVINIDYYCCWRKFMMKKKIANGTLWMSTRGIGTVYGRQFWTVTTVHHLHEHFDQLGGERSMKFPIRETGVCSVHRAICVFNSFRTSSSCLVRMVMSLTKVVYANVLYLGGFFCDRWLNNN